MKIQIEKEDLLEFIQKIDAINFGVEVDLLAEDEKIYITDIREDKEQMKNLEASISNLSSSIVKLKKVVKGGE